MCPRGSGWPRTPGPPAAGRASARWGRPSWSARRVVAGMTPRPPRPRRGHPRPVRWPRRAGRSCARPGAARRTKNGARRELRIAGPHQGGHVADGEADDAVEIELGDVGAEGDPVTVPLAQRLAERQQVDALQLQVALQPHLRGDGCGGRGRFQDAATELTYLVDARTHRAPPTTVDGAHQRVTASARSGPRSATEAKTSGSVGTASTRYGP